MKLVIPKFVLHPQENKYTAGNANSKAQQVDDRKAFVFKQISTGDFQIVLKHYLSIYKWVYCFPNSREVAKKDYMMTTGNNR